MQGGGVSARKKKPHHTKPNLGLHKGRSLCHRKELRRENEQGKLLLAKVGKKFCLWEKRQRKVGGEEITRISEPKFSEILSKGRAKGGRERSGGKEK